MSSLEVHCFCKEEIKALFLLFRKSSFFSVLAHILNLEVCGVNKEK